MKRRTAYYILAALLLCGGIYVLVDLSGPLDEPFTSVDASTIATLAFGVPAVVHQTWKRSVSPPSELVRWRNGCTKLNKGFLFTMYSDEDLHAFTQKHYNKYLPMFERLHGVYMADMARILITYHFGGIYMDLDFYCHKPLQCLIDIAKQQIHASLTSSGLSEADQNDHMPKHILVVAREPLAHAVVFRNKTRVVIQDFFMATPKHPFLLWLLEDRLALFQRSVPSSNLSITSSGVTISSAAQAHHAFPKGPFSYSIEKDIDRYHEYQRHQIDLAHKQHKYGTNSARVSDSDDLGDDVIVELGEEVLHPLVDATNSRLYAYCDRHRAATKLRNVGSDGKGWFGSFRGAGREEIASASSKAVKTPPTTSSAGIGDAPLSVTEQETSGGVHHADAAAAQGHEPPVDFAEAQRQVCRDIESKRFFKPIGSSTVMVHMWTHVYLGWSFVRGLYNMWTYYTVESTLPAQDTCTTYV